MKNKILWDIFFCLGSFLLAKGRGRIFILPIEECIRIRTGETGKEAIG